MWAVEKTDFFCLFSFKEMRRYVDVFKFWSLLCSTSILVGHPATVGYSGSIELLGLLAEYNVLGLLR